MDNLAESSNIPDDSAMEDDPFEDDINDAANQLMERFNSAVSKQQEPASEQQEPVSGQQEPEANDEVVEPPKTDWKRSASKDLKSPNPKRPKSGD
ncbi:hypothetical protein IL306_008458 [Fusarium sp. DS 682]|nr:hypothetical protein IL306_008458 [Fusarium sp. DS 682]